MNKFLLVALTIILPNSAQQLLNFETGFKASSTNPDKFNFELRNKSKSPIAVTLVAYDVAGNPEAVLTPNVNLEAAKNDETYVQAVRVANAPLRYYILLQDGSAQSTYKIDNSNSKDAGKTVFISYENKSLRPQKGVGLLGGAGFNRTTQSGLSLKNNISSSAIKRTEPLQQQLITKFIASFPGDVAQSQPISAGRQQDEQQKIFLRPQQNRAGR